MLDDELVAMLMTAHHVYIISSSPFISTNTHISMNILETTVVDHMQMVYMLLSIDALEAKDHSLCYQPINELKKVAMVQSY
jgi:hypothetical protein